MAGVNHVFRQLSQEDVLVLFLEFTAEETAHVVVVDIVLKRQKIIEYIDGVGFKHVDLSQLIIVAISRRLEVLPYCLLLWVDLEVQRPLYLGLLVIL